MGRSTGLPSGTGETLMSENLGFLHRSAKWVLQISIAVHKRDVAMMRKSNLALLKENESKFYSSTAATDETWINYYNPENKMNFKQW
jgi:hypothetical protein